MAHERILFLPKIRPVVPLNVFVSPIMYDTSSATTEFDFQSITPQVFENFHCSTLLVRIMKSLASVVPMNCVTGLVPELPVSPHHPPDAACQEAFPDASVVRTYPLDAPVVRRNHVNAPVQDTSSL